MAARGRVTFGIKTSQSNTTSVLAKMAATVDIIVGGRLEFGIGAGGSAVSDPAGLQMVLMDLIDAGATHLVLAPTPPIPSEHRAQCLPEEVVEP